MAPGLTWVGNGQSGRVGEGGISSYSFSKWAMPLFPLAGYKLPPPRPSGGLSLRWDAIMPTGGPQGTPRLTAPLPLC